MCVQTDNLNARSIFAPGRRGDSVGFSETLDVCAGLGWRLRDEMDTEVCFAIRIGEQGTCGPKFLRCGSFIVLKTAVTYLNDKQHECLGILCFVAGTEVPVLYRLFPHVHLTLHDL